MKYIVKNLHDLAELKNANLKMSLRSIEIADITLKEKGIEKQLNRHYFACGCQTGSLFVLVTMLTSIIAGVSFGFQGNLVWWKIMIYLAVAAIIGKSFGLLWSYIQLHKIYHTLSCQLTTGSYETD